MTTARKQLVDINTTPYYHCVSRCVRRSFLCGRDELSGKTYEHRRKWLEDKMYQLASIYCIDICAYAVMSNHYHLVVYIDSKRASTLTQQHVVERWSVNHAMPLIILRWMRNEVSKKSELSACNKIIEEWRNRLASLSWFMKELNYYISRKANQEDQCKGHFWESRFKSQALLDEAALLAAMAYVDLNPVRSGEAKKPELSKYTSFKERFDATKENRQVRRGLSLFQRSDSPVSLSFLEYAELVDWTGRQHRDGKVAISASIPPILQRFGLNQTLWLNTQTRFGSTRVTKAGCTASINRLRQKNPNRLSVLCIDQN